MNQPKDDVTALAALRSPEGHPYGPVERLRRFAHLEREDLGIVVVYAVAIGLVSLAVPVAAQALVSNVAFTALLQPLVVLSALVLVGLVAAGILRALQYRVVETLQQRFMVRFTREAVLRLAHADVTDFEARGGRDLVNRFFDFPLVQKAAATLLIDGLSVVLQGGVSLVLLAFYHPALLAFDVVLLGLIAFILFGLGRDGVVTAVKESKSKYATAAWLESMAASIRTFKGPDGAHFAVAKADTLARDYVLARKKHFGIVFRQIVASYTLQAVATAALLGLGGYLVIQGQLTLGQLVAAELIVTGVLTSVAKFGKYLESYYDLAASIDKVGAVVDLRSERSSGMGREWHRAACSVELDGVGYSYDGAARALRDVTIAVAAGEEVAVLGSDASGKSTLVDILYGLREPTDGVYRVDGVDARSLRLPDLRDRVAIVGRNETVRGTVLDNLVLGRKDVDAREVADVLERVALAREVEALPRGAETVLGEHGCRLTSSQTVRLCIARALLSRPGLLVVDEVLDGLGEETAARVLEGIRTFPAPMTTLYFTSRRDVAGSVARVVELDGGTVSVSRKNEEVE
ncbi:MAG: ABC transporter ATP-binding protein [Polyangiaceae bacterium]